MVMRLLPIRIAAYEVSTPGDVVRSEGAEAAQITFDAALGSYRNGVGSITDLNIASTQLLQAKNASIDADAYGALRLQRRPRWRWRPACSVRARHR